MRGSWRRGSRFRLAAATGTGERRGAASAGAFGGWAGSTSRCTVERSSVRSCVRISVCGDSGGECSMRIVTELPHRAGLGVTVTRRPGGSAGGSAISGLVAGCASPSSWRGGRERSRRGTARPRPAVSFARPMGKSGVKRGLRPVAGGPEARSTSLPRKLLTARRPPRRSARDSAVVGERRARGSPPPTSGTSARARPPRVGAGRRRLSAPRGGSRRRPRER